MTKVDVLTPNNEDPTANDLQHMNNSLEGLGGLGGMMGGMMGGNFGSFPAPVPEDGVIDGEAKILDGTEGENTVVEETKNLMVTAVTPFNLSVAKTPDESKVVASVVYLCKDSNDKLFIIHRNFILESKEDLEIIATIPFAEDKDADFISKIVGNHMLTAYLDTYITDMNFEVDEDFYKNPNPILHLKATNTKTKESLVIDVTSEAFACMAYVDNYITEDIMLDHDLQIASVAGSKEPEVPVTFFVVDNVESIVAMASAVPVKSGMEKFKSLFSKKETTNTVGLIVKLNRFITKDDKETASLLLPLDAGKAYPESKFRGKTIKDIQDTYFADGDQYVSTFIVDNIRLAGVDKEYMLIRGKTKDKSVKIFLLDTGCLEDLHHKMEEF